MPKSKVIKCGNLIPAGQKHYVKRHVIIWPRGCCYALTAAMGAGGGFIQLLVVIER